MPRWLVGLALLCSSCGMTPAFAQGYLTAAQIETVRQYLPTYRYAGEEMQVPPLALAAIHYRESDLMQTGEVLPEEQWVERHRRHIPYRNIGGPFMLDRGGDEDPNKFDANIRAYERQVAGWLSISPVPRVRDDFWFACLVAAYELQEKARHPLIDRRGHVDRDALADAMWGYNGRVTRSPWTSAYVANDPHRGVLLTVRVRVGDTTSEYEDGRPGAYVVYRELERRLGAVR